jgi:hypothetical protein
MGVFAFLGFSGESDDKSEFNAAIDAAEKLPKNCSDKEWNKAYGRIADAESELSWWNRRL